MTYSNNKRAKGRPRKAPGHLRNLALRIAVSRLEYEQLKTQAGRSGQRLAAYVRLAALIGSPVVHELLSLLTRLLAQWRGACANLNQASHRANRELAKSDGDHTVVRAEQAQIAGVSVELSRLMNETRDVLARLSSSADAVPPRALSTAPNSDGAENQQESRA